MKKTSSDTKVTRVRTTILSFAVVIAIGVIGYGTLYSTGIAEGEYVEGDHYKLIDNPPRRRPGETIKVTEFFSYGCIHCRNFDPLLENWQKTMPEGVSFSRSPIAFSQPLWSLLGQTYLTLEVTGALEENHSRIFRVIHDNGRQFLSADMIANFVDGHGIEKSVFLRNFNSPKVRRALQQALEDERRLVIPSVPTLMVSDRYLINMDSRKTALDIVDYLISKEMATNKLTTTETVETDS
ncbi:MAG: thiol:disulfide interchange protein DsbA/DsbL [Gammaproteobacteria bacterium]|nr:thiol:disulfide interchange protein DsbA/DsbL [Gammaproteobacteria bacterium]